MADDKRQPWSVADLLDFEFFLNADADCPAQELLERDHSFAEGEFQPEAGPEIRSRGFWLWLKSRRDDSARESDSGIAFSPGQAFEHSRRIVGALLAIVSAVAGAALVWGLLNYESRYFNVLLFLAVTLLPQLFLLLLLIGGWLFRNVIGRSSTLGFFQTLARTAVEWLSQKAWANRLGQNAGRSWMALRRRGYLAWPVAGITQTAGVFYNVGLLLGFVGCLAVMDVRFFWESTPAVAAVESLKGIVGILSAPWVWALPDFAPTMEQIQDTKIELTGGEDGLSERTDSATAWGPFLIATIVTWGLLPRLILRIAMGWMGRRTVRNFTFNERPHRELWRRLTETHVEAKIEGPGDDAVVILWGGMSPDIEELRWACLQQLRFDPVETIAAGGVDPSGDEIALETVAQQLREVKTLSRIVLLAESWGLVPRDLGPFLQAVREEVGDRLPIVCFLVGHPKPETLFTVPDAKELSVWEEFAAGLDDPNLTIRPFRSKGVESVSQPG